MNAERWQLVKKLFQEAAESSPEDRRRLLSDSGADTEVKAEVESLLEAEASPLSMLEPSAARDFWESLSEDASPVSPGTRLGAYRLLGEIGRGGMSLVYLAERADDAYCQQVAVKVIRSEVAGEEARRRFAQERQILANLDHPNIARLLDGGTTEDGVPYLVMERIEGLPIARYCERHGLDLAERLALFRTVCHAVHFAHQNLVVHRDLKPSNILVTAEGVPKLLDFGIAKLLNPGFSPRPSGGGLASSQLMTPVYSSPEQVRGEVITTASDIYSLGVMLYELLTGRRPYELQGKTAAEVRRTICEEEPTPPSENLPDDAPTGRPRQLVGDLDAIVLAALRKEPRRRYRSVEQLAEDLRRHAVHLPVRARRETVLYRFRKFTRRNRLAAALVGLLAALAVATTWQSLRLEGALREAEAQREVAAAEGAKAEEVLTFLIDLFRMADPSGQTQGATSARELLDLGARQARLELAQHGDAQAGIAEAIGRVQLHLGNHQEAEELLAESLALRRKLHGYDHPEVAQSLDAQGLLLYRLGDYRRAEEAHRRALKIRRGAYEDDHPRVADSLHHLAEALEPQERFDEAEALYRQGLAMRQALLEPDHPDIAESRLELGMLLRTLARFDEAEALQRPALASLQKRFGGEHPKVADALDHLCWTILGRGEYSEAEGVCQQGLEIRRRRFGDSHPLVATSLSTLGELHYYAGDFAAAEPRLREALAIWRESGADGKPTVGTALNTLAMVIDAQGRPQEAQPFYLEALEIFQRELGPTHISVSVLLKNVGNNLEDLGRFEEAQKRYEQAVTMQRQVLPADHPELAGGLRDLGHFLARRRDRPDQAADLLRESVRIFRASLGEDDWRTADAQSKWASALTGLRRYAEAELLLRDSLTVLRAARGGDDPFTQRTLDRLVTLFEARGDVEEARNFTRLRQRLEEADGT